MRHHMQKIIAQVAQSQRGGANHHAALAAILHIAVDAIVADDVGQAPATPFPDIGTLQKDPTVYVKALFPWTMSSNTSNKGELNNETHP